MWKCTALYCFKLYHIVLYCNILSSVVLYVLTVELVHSILPDWEVTSMELSSISPHTTYHLHLKDSTTDACKSFMLLFAHPFRSPQIKFLTLTFGWALILQSVIPIYEKQSCKVSSQSNHWHQSYNPQQIFHKAFTFTPAWPLPQGHSACKWHTHLIWGITMQSFNQNMKINNKVMAWNLLWCWKNVNCDHDFSLSRFLHKTHILDLGNKNAKFLCKSNY